MDVNIIQAKEELPQDAFSFYFKDGTNKLTLVSTREPMKIGAITLTQEKPLQAYEEYCKSNEAAGYTAVADVSVTVQAEDAVYKSDSTLYPITDRSSPADGIYELSLLWPAGIMAI